MGDYESYREAAAAILATQSGRPAVDTFGLADVFADGDLSPAYAFLEAQGYRGAVTPALAMLGAARADVLLAAPCASVAAVPGWYDGASVLVGDQSRSDLAPLARGGAHADDYLTLFDVDAGTAGEHADAIARLRVGAAAELLGVCDRLLADAVAHARSRRQFGQSIADFQAVQHLLAWAATERHQLRCLLDIAVRRVPEPLLAETLKALAGRVFYAVVQTAIQVTGAIGFTWEYSLNRLHHRGLALDQLAGSSAELTKTIGKRVRTQRSVPALVELAVE